MLIRALSTSLLTSENRFSHKPHRPMASQSRSPQSQVLPHTSIQTTQPSHALAATPFTFNTLQDPNLLKEQGQYQAAGKIIASLGKETESIPPTCQVIIVLSDDKTEEKLAQFIQNANQIILANGMTNTVKHQLFRSVTGIHGKLYPITLQSEAMDSVSNQQEGRKVLLTLNLSGLSSDDFSKISHFINQKISKQEN